MSDRAAGKSVRLEGVDAVRGIAVLAMVEWHTVEGWVREPERSSDAFRLAEIVGGLAAPFFFLLAGLSAGLSEKLPTPRPALEGAVRRALSIVVAGYGLRTFSWGVDYSALVESEARWVVVMAVGLALTWLALTGEPRRRWLLAPGIVAVFVAVVAMSAESASIALRLDVLHGIGVALLLLAPLLAVSSRASTGTRVAVVAVLALIIALLGPLVLAMRAPPGPIRLWDYVARFDVSPAASGARFPIVPWLAYAAFGATIGRAMRGRAPRGGALGLPLDVPPGLVLVIAALVAVLSFEAGPVAQWILGHAPWLRNVLRVTFYASTATALAAAVALALAPSGVAARVLCLLGRHSLVIYAAHLEIAYGLPGSLIRHELSWWEWAGLALPLLLSMIALAWVLDRREARDHERSRA